MDARYPVGPFVGRPASTREERAPLIRDLGALPADFRAALAGLSDAQLDTPYRAGGWTLRQVAHHLPDSHLNAYLRMKLALTEEAPTIKPYDEARWAELPDTTLPVEVSLRLLEALHERWTSLLVSLHEADWQRGFVNPERGGVTPLGEALAMYVWHGRHHLAHVTRLRRERGWT